MRGSSRKDFRSSSTPWRPPPSEPRTVLARKILLEADRGPDSLDCQVRQQCRGWQGRLRRVHPGQSAAGGEPASRRGDGYGGPERPCGDAFGGWFERGPPQKRGRTSVVGPGHAYLGNLRVLCRTGRSGEAREEGEEK